MARCNVYSSTFLKLLSKFQKKLGDYLKLCGLLTISKLYLITAFLYSFAGELPDPNQDAIMARCSVCSEKAYVNPCAHCDKKCCDDCKEAHCDILKREISRVNNQVKRGWHRLEDCVQQVS